MVHKTSHRGVHSGNTLRAFNSRYSRRYQTQACIVSRVRPELLKKLVNGENGGRGSEADDKQAALRLNNIAVNVALSLNKQSRWLLPSALIRQVRSNDIAQDLTVSVLERHKLKRPASCVSYHSNKGELKRIQPRNGRYFSFNFPTADGKSRREYRRERQQELMEQIKKSRADGKEGKITGKKIEVFTETGRAKRDMEIGESEVRYEVFYPSPAQSSISHNPKYIKQDVSDAPGDDSEHVEHGKPRKQHRGKQRKRMSVKDIDDCDLPSYNPYDDDQELASLLEIEEALTVVNEKENFPALDRVEHSTTDCLLSSLIEKAERLQSLVGEARTRRRKKSGSKTGTARHHQDDKSHIVYLTPDPQASPDSDEDEAPTPAFLAPAPAAPSDPTRVLLPNEDVTVTSLKESFGQSYFEAACTPRKFVLDITTNVRELLKKKGVQLHVANNTEKALTYLIFVYDGFYDEEHNVYRVLLNSRLRQGLLPVAISSEENQDLYRGTVINLVSCAVDFAESFVEELQEHSHFPYFLDGVNRKIAGRELKHHLGSAEAYIPSLERIFQKGSTLTDFTLPSISDMLQEEPAFCDVCYDDISPLTQDSAASTALLKCHHRVCDSCWAQHIHSRLQQGFVRVTCPGYDCQEEVKVGVLLSVAPLDVVEKVLQRQEEVRIGASPTEKWCPNESCGRVLHLQPASTPNTPHQLQQDVVCACGAHVCFQCLFPAHWPASCAQAEDYRSKVASTVFPDREAEVHDDSRQAVEAKLRRQQEAQSTMLVEGKHCPKCKSFVNKNGGCPQMTCRCGQIFCWFCGKAGYSHPDRRGCVDEETEKKLTTTIVVRHLEVKTDSDKKEQERQKASAVRRQRVSLMERAAEHRQRRLSGQHGKAIASMSKAVAAAAAKDKKLAEHILSVCSRTFPSSDCITTPTPFSQPQGRVVNVMDTVATFLKRAARSKQELHEMAEYSLVLLKDLPDSLHRRRALRIAEDLGAFCTFTQSIFDSWGAGSSGQGHLQEGVKAITRLAEIQGWVNSALASHLTAVRKLRNSAMDKQ